MSRITADGTSVIEVRSLDESDLEAVVALDRAIVGRSRRGYFERRLASALRDPKTHVQLAATGPRGLVGFVLARSTSGEYGRPAPAALLEAVGVAPAAQRAGIGRRMMSALHKKCDARGLESVVTELDWRNHAMLKFLDGAGFTLAPRLLLERKVARMPLPDTDEAIAPGGATYVRSGSDAVIAQPAPASGIVLDTSVSPAEYVFPTDLLVDPTLDHDVKVVFHVNTYQDFRWEDSPGLGYESGVFDVTPLGFEAVTQLGANAIATTFE